MASEAHSSSDGITLGHRLICKTSQCWRDTEATSVLSVENCGKDKPSTLLSRHNRSYQNAIKLGTNYSNFGYCKIRYRYEFDPKSGYSSETRVMNDGIVGAIATMEAKKKRVIQNEYNATRTRQYTPRRVGWGEEEEQQNWRRGKKKVNPVIASKAHRNTHQNPIALAYRLICKTQPTAGRARARTH